MPRITEPGKAEVFIASFGQKYPRQVRTQYEANVTNFRDPIGQNALRSLNGRHAAVREFIKKDDRCEPLLSALWLQVRDQLGSQRSSYISIGLLDYHGSHTSVAIAEELADRLSGAGYKVEVKHYNLGGGK